MFDKTDEYESRIDRKRQDKKTDEPTPKYKDGNPKTALGIRKPGDWSTPTIPYLEYSLAHMQGDFKYTKFNWVDDPVSISTYIEAAKRHMDLYKAGQKNASDTGIHHLAHAMCCLSIIIDAEAHGTLIDDRFKYRDEDHVGKDRTEVLEQYIKDAEPRIKRIYDEWYGFAEANKYKYGQKSDDKFGAGPLELDKEAFLNDQQPKLSGFMKDMIAHPEKAIGRRGYWSITGDAATYIVEKVEGSCWLVKNMSGEQFRIPFADFTIDSGR